MLHKLRAFALIMAILTQIAAMIALGVYAPFYVSLPIIIALILF
jgi:hypothetical protein